MPRDVRVGIQHGADARPDDLVVAFDKPVAVAIVGGRQLEFDVVCGRPIPEDVARPADVAVSSDGPWKAKQGKHILLQGLDNVYSTSSDVEWCVCRVAGEVADGDQDVVELRARLLGYLQDVHRDVGVRMRWVAHDRGQSRRTAMIVFLLATSDAPVHVGDDRLVEAGSPIHAVAEKVERALAAAVLGALDMD